MNSKINLPFGETRTGMWSGGGYTCSWPITFDNDLPGKLRLQYSNPEEKIDWDSNKLPSQAEITLLFSALCADRSTLEIIAPKLKKIYEPVGVFYRRMLHEDLIRLLIKLDDARAFELLVTYDPYNALNAYDPNDKTGEFDKPFLNSLINIVRHNQKVKADYVNIYKDCGGKTLEELEPTKCIIS
jgi:hypothetical protein